jgi:predicted outer membrane protein
MNRFEEGGPNMRRIGMWVLALAAGWLMNAGLGWSADAPVSNAVLGKLHHANMKEIAMSRLAQKNARTRQVKDFAETLIEDNAAMDRGIVALAKEQRLDLAASTPPLNPSDLEALRDAVDFDATFTKVLHDDQEDAIAEASAAHDMTQDAKLRVLLSEILPTLRAHRDMAKLILDQNVPRASL